MRVSGSAAAVVFVINLVLFPVLYVASTGPAVWCMSTGCVGNETLMAVYWPLEQLANACEPVGDALDQYVSLWDTPAIMPAPTPPAMSVPAPGS